MSEHGRIQRVHYHGGTWHMMMISGLAYEFMKKAWDVRVTYDVPKLMAEGHSDREIDIFMERSDHQRGEHGKRAPKPRRIGVEVEQDFTWKKAKDKWDKYGPALGLHLLYFIITKNIRKVPDLGRDPFGNTRDVKVYRPSPKMTMDEQCRALSSVIG